MTRIKTMTLDITKVSIKTSLESCFGHQSSELEGATDFFNELAEKAEEVFVGANEYILRENDANHYVYLPVSGSIMLERSTSTGSRQVFAFLFTGNMLGVSELPYYSFSAKTLTDATVIKINQKLISAAFDKYPVVIKN